MKQSALHQQDAKDPQRCNLQQPKNKEASIYEGTAQGISDLPAFEETCVKMWDSCPLLRCHRPPHFEFAGLEFGGSWQTMATCHCSRNHTQWWQCFSGAGRTPIEARQTQCQARWHQHLSFPSFHYLFDHDQDKSPGMFVRKLGTGPKSGLKRLPLSNRNRKRCDLTL